MRYIPVLCLAGGIAFLGASHERLTSAAEARFMAENAVAMNVMMQRMDVVATGSIDRDFAAMMIPHHQGAIDMAVSELRYGRNETLRRLSQEIIVTQQQEIAAMRLAIGSSR